MITINSYSEEDFIKESSIEWSNFKDASILVTGAEGELSSFVLKALSYADEKMNLNAQIFDSIGKSAEYWGKSEVLNKIEYIFHCADTPDSEAISEHPVNTIITSYMELKNLLNLAKDNATKLFVYVSSEKNLSDFPESRRLCENMCVSYSKEFGVPVKIISLKN